MAAKKGDKPLTQISLIRRKGLKEFGSGL